MYYNDIIQIGLKSYSGTTGSYINISGDILPSTSNLYSLGATGFRWSELYVGPGTINISGPGSVIGKLGTDQNGILFSENGLATPFINIGPTADALNIGSIGGWQLSPTGTIGTTGYNLIAQQKLSTSGLTGPIYSLINSAPNLGSVIIVDNVNGNDTFASLINGIPYATINAAISAVGTLNKTIWVLPGIYNITPITLPSNISIRGISVQNVTLQMTNVTSDTTLLTMGENSRIEDITLKLTSSGHYNLVGVLFPGTTTMTSKIRTTTVTVDNSTASSTGTSNIYCVQSTGSGSGINAFAFNSIKGCTMTTNSNGGGNKRTVLISSASTMTIRDCNFYCSAPTTSTSTGSYIAIETSNSSAQIQVRTSTISGPLTSGSFINADISQSSGKITIGPGTDVYNRNANGNTFDLYINSNALFYGLKGNIKTSTVSPGYLWLGSLTSTNNIYPDSSIAYYRVSQKSILYGMTSYLTTAPSSTYNIVLTVYVNNSPTAFTITYSGTTNGSLTNYAQSISLAQGDLLSLQLTYTGSNSNNAHDLTVQLDLF